MFLIQVRKGTEFKLKVGRDIQRFLHEDRKSKNCVFIYSIFDFKLKHLRWFLNVQDFKWKPKKQKQIYTNSLYNNLANDIDNKQQGVLYIARL